MRVQSLCTAWLHHTTSPLVQVSHQGQGFQQVGEACCSVLGESQEVRQLGRLGPAFLGWPFLSLSQALGHPWRQRDQWMRLWVVKASVSQHWSSVRALCTSTGTLSDCDHGLYSFPHCCYHSPSLRSHMRSLQLHTTLRWPGACVVGRLLVLKTGQRACWGTCTVHQHGRRIHYLIRLPHKPWTWNAQYFSLKVGP